MSFIKNIIKKYPYLIASIAIVVVGGIIFYEMNPSPIADEEVHILQVKHNFRGELKLSSFITNIPGYHYTLTYMAKVSDLVIHHEKHPKRKDVRLFQMFISILFPISIFLLIKKLKQKKTISASVNIITDYIYIFFCCLYRYFGIIIIFICFFSPFK